MTHWLISACFALICAAAFVRFLPTRRDLITIGLFAVALLAVYMVQRHPLGYTYDLSQHQNTVRYYAEHLSMPAADGPHESHQPPLYYFIAGLVYRATLPLGEENAWFFVTEINYVLYCFMLLYGLRILAEAVPSTRLQQIGAVALVLWPVGIVHATRVGNDGIIYLAFAAAFYHWLRWHRFRLPREFSLTLLWAAAAFATKNSAIVLPLILGGISLSRRCLRADARALFARTSRVALVVLCASLAVGIGRTVAANISNPNSTIIEGKQNAPTQWQFQPASFISLAYDNYLDHPYVRYVWPDSPPGTIPTYNELFWNFFLRTFSFGEYSWAGIIHASRANFFMLGMFAALAATSPYPNRTRSRAGRDAIIALTCCIAALIGARIYFNAAEAWADARHLHTLTIFFLTAYLAKLCDIRRTVWLFRTGMFLLLGYIVCEAVHHWLQLGHAIGGGSPHSLSWGY